MAGVDSLSGAKDFVKISVIRPAELAPPELARWRRLQALSADLSGARPAAHHSLRAIAV
jgi:hypothetical protein